MEIESQVVIPLPVVQLKDRNKENLLKMEIESVS